jgi:putative GTP pyrophosphokinase
VDEALIVVSAYRAGFRDALDQTADELSRLVAQDSLTDISRRLKRTPQILDKLARFPSMRLTQMADIAGCRTVLADVGELEEVLRTVRRNWEVIAVDDYVQIPKVTGYRAVHVIVGRDGRPVEIQLRTRGQHDWAGSVERVAARTGQPLKDGEGAHDLLTYFELLGLVTAAEDGDDGPGAELDEIVRRFRSRLEHRYRTRL